MASWHLGLIVSNIWTLNHNDEVINTTKWQHHWSMFLSCVYFLLERTRSHGFIPLHFHQFRTNTRRDRAELNSGENGGRPPNTGTVVIRVLDPQKDHDLRILPTPPNAWREPRKKFNESRVGSFNSISLKEGISPKRKYKCYWKVILSTFIVSSPGLLW